MPPAPTKKRARIIEAGETLFLRHGIKRVTVEEICRSAGSSKMTFYKYFTGKIDLMNEIWRLWIEERRAEMKKIDAGDHSFIEKLLMMFEYKSEFINTFSPEFLTEAMELQLDFQAIMDEFESMVNRARQRGEIRAEIHPHFLIAMIKTFYELSKDPTLTAHYENLLALRKEALYFFLYGISPRPENRRKAL